MKRWKAIASAVALCIGISGAAWAQQDWDRHDRDNRGQWGWQQGRDNDGDRDDNPQVWKRRDRDRDRDRDHGYRNGPYYPNGTYGYPGPYYPNGRYPSPNGRGPYYPNGSYGYPYGVRNPAYQIGYQDGAIDGRNDYMARRSPQPYQDHNYKYADHGYSSSYGDKNAYRAAYRDAYMQGYQQGYGRY